MTVEVDESAEIAAVRREAGAWLEANWDPDLTLGQWWKLLLESGWGQPTWPSEWFGRDIDAQAVAAVGEEFRRVGAAMGPYGVHVMMAGPAILAHGTDEQKRRFLVPMLLGEDEWCQLFSEPDAGSDLASLSTRAERDGDGWRLSGQKVWTSLATFAKWGFCLARTDADVPKHKGITYFLVDMEQPGIEVRPLREMTGGAAFNEVFLDAVWVPPENVLGDVGDGWRVAMTTLSHERQSMGAVGDAGGGEVYGKAPLDTRAGDVAGAAHQQRGRRIVMGNNTWPLVRDLFAAAPGEAGAAARQGGAELYSFLEVARFTRLRNQAMRALGRNPGPAASVGKLATSRLARRIRDLTLALVGPAGMLAGDDAPYEGLLAEMALFSPSVSIAGGTDEVQRNIVGERVLGLPREPQVGAGATFRELQRSGPV